MKNLSKYVQESIFDIDDNIDKVDDDVFFYKWITEFESTSDIRKTINDFLNDVIKRGGKFIKSNSLKGDEIFVIYAINNKTNYYEWFISFYWPKSHNLWKQASIGKSKWHKDIKFLYPDNTLLDKSGIQNRNMNKDIIILPKKYMKLIKLICERSK